MQVITDKGLAALANASVKGFQLSVGSFAVTETAPTALPSDDKLAGVPIFTGKIDVVEVLSEATVKFTVTIPEGVPETNSWSIKEAGVFLDDGTLFSHGKLEPYYDKNSSFGLRFFIYISAARLGDVINISTSTVNSIPSIAYVRSIPKASDLYENTIAVLDEWNNPDGSYSPSMAIKYGPGSKQIGYIGYDRIYYGTVGRIGADNSFYLDIDEAGIVIADGERVIVQEVVGGNERSHKYFYRGANWFTLIDGTPAINMSSQLAIWKRTMPLVSSGTKIVVRTHTFISQGVSYSLPFTPKGDALTMVFAGTLYQESSVSGREIRVDGIKAGLECKVISFDTEPIAEGEKPSRLQTLQYDFPKSTARSMRLGVTPASKNHVLVFKSGALLRDDSWNLINEDIILSSSETAGAVFSVIVFNITESKKSFTLTTFLKEKLSSGGKQDVYVEGLKARQSLVFASGLLQQNSTYSITDNNLTTDFLIPSPVSLTVRQFYSEATGYMFALKSELTKAVSDVYKDGDYLAVVKTDGSSSRVNVGGGPYVFGFPLSCNSNDVVTYGITGGDPGETVTVQVQKDGVEWLPETTVSLGDYGYWCSTANVQEAGTYKYLIKFPKRNKTMLLTNVTNKWSSHAPTIFGVPNNCLTGDVVTYGYFGGSPNENAFGTIYKDGAVLIPKTPIHADINGYRCSTYSIAAAGDYKFVFEFPDHQKVTEINCKCVAGNSYTPVLGGGGSGSSGVSSVTNTGSGEALVSGTGGAIKISSVKAGSNVSIIRENDGSLTINAASGGGGSGGMVVYSGSAMYLNDLPSENGDAVIPLPAGVAASQCTFFWSSVSHNGVTRSITGTPGQYYNGDVANVAYLIFVKG